jgi:tripartite-type tricarboxylate transporter receptor subunit TctC
LLTRGKTIMEKISRRQLIGAAAAAPLLGLAAQAAAQPAGKTITLVATASPGTSLDTAARFLAEPLGKAMNAPVVVENRVGANGIIGTEYVSRSTPDGTTLLMAASNHFINKFTAEAPLPYDPEKDFTPVAKLFSGPLIVLVPESSRYKTLADLVVDMKARPGEVTYSTAGVGSTTHLCVILLNQLTNTKARHIPYKGAAGAVTDTVSGQVDFTCQSPSTGLALVKAGKLRALALSGERRLDGLKDVPSGVELGVGNFYPGAWVGVLAPAATPLPIVDRLSREILAIAATPAFKTYCDNILAVPNVVGAEEARRQFPADAERWREVIAASKTQ